MTFPVGTVLLKRKPLEVPDRACNCPCIAQTGAASEPRLKSLKDLKDQTSVPIMLIINLDCHHAWEPMSKTNQGPAIVKALKT